MGKLFRTFGLPLILGLGYFIYTMVNSDIKSDSAELKTPQTKITTPGQLILANHSVNGAGHMLSALREFNEQDLSAWQKFRLKKFDYYDVITEDFILTFALADVFIAGEVRLNFFDYNTKEYKTFRKTVLPNKVPNLGPGTHNFASKNPEDNVSYKDEDFTIQIKNIKSDNPDIEIREVFVQCNPLNIGLEFYMNKHKEQDIHGAVVPLTSDAKYFFYALKMPNLPAEGALDLNGRVYPIDPNKASSFIDWGRAVFTYNTHWLFLRGQGFAEDGHRFSVSFDSFFVNHTMHMLNTMETKFDENNLMNPFNIGTVGTELKNSQCEMIFAPQYVEKKVVNYVIVHSDMRVVYGKLSGWVTDENNNKYAFEDINAYFEVFKTKW